jgi:hypothetical protein
MMSVMKSLRILGKRFYGRAYLAPLAKGLGTDVYTLRRWLRKGKGPADLHERRDALLRELMRERLIDVVSASSMLARLQQQTSIWDRDRALKVSAFRALMYPAPPLYDDGVSTQPDMSTPPKTIDELCDGADPMIAAQLREILEEIE